MLDADVWQAHVAPITSTIERAGITGNVFLTSKVTGLPKDSIAVPLGLELVGRSLLDERVGCLPAVVRGGIDAGIRAVLGL